MTSSSPSRQTLPRPLPRSLAPQPSETLSGYLLNLSYRLDTGPGDLAIRTGLEHASTVSINTGFNLALPPHIADRFAAACGLDQDEISALTLSRWDGLLFDSAAPAKAARTLHGNGWLIPTLTRACPACLTDTPAHAPDRVTWQAAWKTPWAVACIRHGTLLNDSCTDCGTPYGASGHRVRSLIPNPTAAASHPAACRARPSSTDTLCGSRIDQQPAAVAPAPLLALQDTLDRLLDGTAEQPRSLGLPVAPAQHLRDLRALAVLLQLADHRHSSVPLPDHYNDALRRHLDARAERRDNRTADDRSDRTWTEPPTDTRVLASLLIQAATILALPDAAAARDVLPPLVTAANTRERLAWGRLRSASQPSDGLFRYFAPKRAGTFSTHMLSTADPAAAITITSDHVPAYLDQARYDRSFSTFDPAAERNIRRAVPLAITQLAHNTDLTTAANLLNIPFVSAQAAVIRAGRACKRTGRDDEFRTLISTTATDLAAQPINYGHRRRTLNATWTIPEPDWQALVQAMLSNRTARKDTPWAERRTAITVWTWSLVTSSDPALAPMIATTSDSGRRSTGRELDAYTTLTRRAAPALTSLINNYAEDLASRVDASNP